MRRTENPHNGLGVAAVGKWCRIGRRRKCVATQTIRDKTVEYVANGKGGEKREQAPTRRRVEWDVKKTEQRDKEEDAADYMTNSKGGPSEPRKIRSAEKSRCKDQQDEAVEPARCRDAVKRRRLGSDEAHDDASNSTNAENESDAASVKLESLRLHWTMRAETANDSSSETAEAGAAPARRVCGEQEP